MKAIRRVYGTRPKCFGEMYQLPEEEMFRRCADGGCRSFHDCERLSASKKPTVPGPIISMESAVDKEYRVKW